MGQPPGFVGNYQLAAILALAWHAKGQGFKSPILHCGTAAKEQESGESSEERRTRPARFIAPNVRPTSTLSLILDGHLNHHMAMVCIKI